CCTLRSRGSGCCSLQSTDSSHSIPSRGCNDTSQDDRPRSTGRGGTNRDIPQSRGESCIRPGRYRGGNPRSARLRSARLQSGQHRSGRVAPGSSGASRETQPLQESAWRRTKTISEPLLCLLLSECFAASHSDTMLDASLLAFLPPPIGRCCFLPTWAA